MRTPLYPGVRKQMLFVIQKLPHLSIMAEELGLHPESLGSRCLKKVYTGSRWEGLNGNRSDLEAGGYL